MSGKRTELKDAAEADLETFIRLVAPHRVLGDIHKQLFFWWGREGAKSHQLVLLPRDHQKSAMIAYRVAWHITKDPSIRVLYISSTANLAQKQLKFIKDILTSDTYRLFWPEMVHPDEGKRERWTLDEFAVDHPLRKAEGVRDPTVFTGGLTTSLTGLHCDIAVLDDVVVQENAYSQDGRKKVEEQYSLLASIEGADAKEWVVGTRYHPRDLYNKLEEMEEDVFHDETGEIVGKEKIYEVFQSQVEDRGDGTGQFIWPRQRRSDGKWFGFDQQILAKKRGQYLDRRQFRAQYYNDPNAPGEGGIKPEYFQYYDKKFLERQQGVWFFSSRRLNVFAAIDFAFSTASRSDDTSIVVVGVDRFHNYYVLDIDRFKTDRIKDYFDHALDLHKKWGFRKIRAEVNVAQKPIVNALKEYIKQYGIALSIDEFRPSRVIGSKEERMDAVLRPRYENRQVFHYHGGNTQTLEEELVNDAPPHDDTKDALASAIDISKPPIQQGGSYLKSESVRSLMYNKQFGGIG